LGHNVTRHRGQPCDGRQKGTLGVFDVKPYQDAGRCRQHRSGGSTLDRHNSRNEHHELVETLQEITSRFARREISEETSVLLLGDKRKYAMWLISRALSYSDSGISGCQRLVCHVKPQLIYPICCWTDRRKHILPAFQETRRQDEGLFRPSVRKTEFHFIRRRHRKGDARAQPVEDRSTLHQWKFAALD
jgi:hypothetical protein